jgi:hypothetical protein
MVEYPSGFSALAMVVSCGFSPVLAFGMWLNAVLVRGG